MPLSSKAPSLTVRSLLKSEFKKRKKRNPAYSVRGFALSLGISSSFLSKILKGHRPVGKSTLEKIATRLKWDDAITKKLNFERPLREKKRTKKVLTKPMI